MWNAKIETKLLDETMREINNRGFDKTFRNTAQKSKIKEKSLLQGWERESGNHLAS